MEATTDDKRFPEFSEHSSQLWVKNPHGKNTLPVVIEPWGARINLLPAQSYVVVSEFEPTDEVEALSIEPNGRLTVWPQGTKRNRIYRENGRVVWDDERPSEVYRFLTDLVVSTALRLVSTSVRVEPDQLSLTLKTALPLSQHYRDDVAYLLVEHGLLRLEEDGSVQPPEAPDESTLIPEGTIEPASVSDSRRDSVPHSKVFVVHGRDEGAREALSRFIEKLKLETVVLHEQPDGGRTIIEKFELYSDVGFAIVLLTPDDVGYPKDKPEDARPRARQNMVFELGYFVGKLGRGRVTALYKEGVDMPSDYQGVLYIPIDDAGGWRLRLARELKEAGADIDMNNAL